MIDENTKHTAEYSQKGATHGTDEYDPFVRGRFPVGVRTIQGLDTVRDRRFPCEIWYFLCTHYDASFNATTPGTTQYNLFLQPSTGTNDNAVGITFGANNAGSPLVSPVGGIYLQSSSVYGSRMWLGTTDTFGGTGVKTAVEIDEKQRMILTGITFANLGSPANGAVVYCSDCTKSTPCASGGNGALAKRLNGAWDCN